MKQTILFSSRPDRLLTAGILMIAGILSMVLSSPKCGLAFFAWLQPLCWLAYYQLSTIRRKALWAIPALILGHFLAGYAVVPFPPLFLLVVGVYQSLGLLGMLALNRWVTRRVASFAGTLFFPSIAVAWEFGNSFLGGGIWGSVANTQYAFSWLTQLASVTGIWGISFILYWTASVVVWLFAAKDRGERTSTGLGIYGGLIGAVLLMGLLRHSGVIDANLQSPERKVNIAGVTVPMLPLLQTFYSDYCGRHLSIDPKASITDPALRQVGAAEGNYIETGDTVRFRHVVAAIHTLNDSLFALSHAAADRGAQIICWSEGNSIVWKTEEQAMLERGRKFAVETKVYLLLTMCVLEPGKITPGKKFLGNEAVFIGPDGVILTRFYKNHPVPMAEASEPGNGIIPVLQTPYGRVAISICYDADFPAQMRQLSRQKADLLLLPSGDWYAISTFHTYMAVYRGIENGCSIFRETSNGLSIATDYRSKVAGSRDYFREGLRMWSTDLPVAHVDTIYSHIGDILAYVCILFVLLAISFLLAGDRWPDSGISIVLGKSFPTCHE